MCRLRTIAIFLGICLVLYLFASILLLILSPLQIPHHIHHSVSTSLDGDLHDNSTVLADFSFTSNETAAAYGGKFFFGVATAPAQVEDSLDDMWLEFARKIGSSVRSWRQVPKPDERLRFWSDPEPEIILARSSGATVFRMGIDWGRIVPMEPSVHGGTLMAAHIDSINRYKIIMEMVHAHGMRVMLTLFHHSMPKWAMDYGGWVATDGGIQTASYFAEFAALARDNFGHLVDYWITFNEPDIFAMLTYCSGGLWPSNLVLNPNPNPNRLSFLFCVSPWGRYGKAMSAITKAHKAAYKELKLRNESILVGVAHAVAVIRPYSLLDAPVAVLVRKILHFPWIQTIETHLDFCGINYYGQEVVSIAGLMFDEEEEYSEAGRSVFPEGLPLVLSAFHSRFPRLPFVITENGVADSLDALRRPYLIEHLIALHFAIAHLGIPVIGYIHWTLSDNWEWSDGYCPKFGLVHVDRLHNLTRLPCPSFHLYHEISESSLVTSPQRVREWETLQALVRSQTLRPLCREIDAFERMGLSGLDVPVMRPFSRRDWRFSKYESHPLGVYVYRSFKATKIFILDIVQFVCGALTLPSSNQDQHEL